jgi:hypothetical protein
MKVASILPSIWAQYTRNTDNVPHVNRQLMQKAQRMCESILPPLQLNPPHMKQKLKK